MKKKFISALLFGAILAASSSTLVSCKGYDDDISNLQGQITTNASDLSELVNEKINNLTQEINSLKAQDAALESALNTAKSELTATIEAAAQGAKDYADVQAAAAQVAAIEASKANIEEARKLLQAGIDDANAAIEKLNSQVATQAEQIDGLLSADAALQTAINTANGEIEVAKSMAEAAQNAADQNAEALKQVAENLATAKSELESQISVLGDKIDGAIEDIAKNKADVEAQLATVNSLISSNTEAIEALKNTDSELLDKITENTNKLIAMGETLSLIDAKVEANLQAAKAYTDTEIATLKAALNYDIDIVRNDLNGALTRIGAAERQIEGINEAIEGLKNKDTELEGALNQLSEKVDENIATFTFGIAQNAAKIATLEGNVEQNTTDIKTLQELAAGLRDDLDKTTITANNANEAIERLRAEYEAYVQNNDQALAKLKGDLNSNLYTAISQLGADLRDELQTEVGKLDATISTLATKEELKEQIDALKLQIGAITGDDSTVGLIDEKIKEVNEKIKNLTENEIADLTSRISVAENKINNIYQKLAQNSAAIGQAINAFNNELSNLYSVLSKQLKAIVFSPNEYYQGIEAIGVWSFNYKAVTGGVQNPDINKDQTNDQITRLATSETSVVPVVVASYYLNPSNAYVDTNKDKYKFTVNNASYTRAASASDINVDSVKRDNDKINVYFSMQNANNIEKIPTSGDGKVDVAALRYNYSTENGNDTTITSDFAALKQYAITAFYINKANNGNAQDANSGHNHLAETAKKAIARNSAGEYTAPTLEIAYNKTEGIDLDKWINVHYDYNNSSDKYWGDQDEINKKRFKLIYELIGYQANDADNTNESQHATIDPDTHILTVHGIDGEEGSRKIIGRTPLVRVKLIDNNTQGQLVTVGYILVKITDVTTDPIIIDKVAPITPNYTVSCDPSNALNGVKAITWEEVENMVLDTLDMSKDEFEANYTLECNSGTNNAVQYEFDSYTSRFNAIAENSQIGTIINTTDDGSHETNILKWTVSNNQAYQLFVNEKRTSVHVYVKFAPKNTVHGQKAVYVKLTWTPQNVFKTPTAEIINNENHKKYADWHVANSREEGFEELHVQVGNATVPGAECEYENLVVSNTFNKQPIDIVKDAIKGQYPELANATSITYRFSNNQSIKTYTAQDGTSYTVRVTNDGKYIEAGGSVIAEIDPQTGKIIMHKNTPSMAIINNYDKGKLEAALTLTVEVVPTTCAPAANIIKLNNNTFNVKVIKPLFITGADEINMELNNFSTLTQKVVLNFEDFNEYDPTKFWENSLHQVEFWKFYGINKIEVGGTIETNYSNKNQWEAVNPDNFTITYTAPTGDIKLDNMGSITLSTGENMSRANSFQVRVPLKVTYKWGTLTETVTVNVMKAPGTKAIKR